MFYYDRIDLSEGHDVVQTTTVTAVKNGQFVTLGVLIMGSNFKFLFVMVVVIFLLSLLKVLVIIVLFMTLENLK